MATIVIKSLINLNCSEFEFEFGIVETVKNSKLVTDLNLMDWFGLLLAALVVSWIDHRGRPN